MNDDLRDETEQVIQRSQDIKDRVHEIQDRAEQAGKRTEQPTPADPRRALEARAELTGRVIHCE